jgi:hypothetical protein
LATKAGNVSPSPGGEKAGMRAGVQAILPMIFKNPVNCLFFTIEPPTGAVPAKKDPVFAIFEVFWPLDGLVH